MKREDQVSSLFPVRFNEGGVKKRKKERKKVIVFVLKIASHGACSACTLVQSRRWAPNVSGLVVRAGLDPTSNKFFGRWELFDTCGLSQTFALFRHTGSQRSAGGRDWAGPGGGRGAANLAICSERRKRNERRKKD